MFHFRAGGAPDLSGFHRAQVALDARGAAVLAPGAVSGTLATEIVPDEPFGELVLSWEASAPPGTWVELRASARTGDHWTRPYVLGIWSESAMRHSVDEQKDADGDVLVDTLVLAGPATALRIQATLVTARPPSSPALRALHAIVTPLRSPPPLLPDHTAWGVEVGVPARSQMPYPQGGNVWCSPTSTSMLLDYWGVRAQVPEAAERIYDWMAEGTVNWPFATAFAAVRGGPAVEAFVTRLYAIEQLERLVAAGVPVAASIAFDDGQLPGAPMGSTDGHLLVVRGFDPFGDVMVNDPAAPTDDLVRRVYDRAAFDRAWERSRRTIYVVHPLAQPLPVDGSLGSW